MTQWLKRRKSVWKRRRRKVDKRGVFDFLLELLFWIPELIIFPIRVVAWLLKEIFKWIGLISDVT